MPEKVNITAGRAIYSQISQEQSEHGNVNEEPKREGEEVLLSTDFLPKLNFSPFDRNSNYTPNNNYSPIRGNN